jgi:hypothetical protein
MGERRVERMGARLGTFEFAGVLGRIKAEAARAARGRSRTREP